MKLSEGLLWVASALFIAFGLAFAVAPEEAAEFVTDVRPGSSSAVIDMRAAYGGLPIGLGLFIGACARRPSWVRPGLLVSLLSVAGLGVARLVGIVADGSPNGMMWAQLALEVVAAGVLVAALRTEERADEVAATGVR